MLGFVAYIYLLLVLFFLVSFFFIWLTICFSDEVQYCLGKGLVLLFVRHRALRRLLLLLRSYSLGGRSEVILDGEDVPSSWISLSSN